MKLSSAGTKKVRRTPVSGLGSDLLRAANSSRGVAPTESVFGRFANFRYFSAKGGDFIMTERHALEYPVFAWISSQLDPTSFKHRLLQCMSLSVTELGHRICFMTQYLRSQDVIIRRGVTAGRERGV